MTAAQYVRWSNRREKAQGSLYEALGHIRAAADVTEASELTMDEGDAEQYMADAAGCIEGALALLHNALACMERQKLATEQKKAPTP